MGYGAFIVQWRLDISVKSAPNPTYVFCNREQTSQLQYHIGLRNCAAAVYPAGLFGLWVDFGLLGHVDPAFQTPNHAFTATAGAAVIIDRDAVGFGHLQQIDRFITAHGQPGLFEPNAMLAAVVFDFFEGDSIVGPRWFFEEMLDMLRRSIRNHSPYGS